jgi:TPR repeat protein
VKRWLSPAALTALAAACATLAKCYSDTVAARDRVEEARWKRENGMAYYQQAYEDAAADLRTLTVTVMASTNLTELQTMIKIPTNHP